MTEVQTSPIRHQGRARESATEGALSGSRRPLRPYRPRPRP